MNNNDSKIAQIVFSISGGRISDPKQAEAIVSIICVILLVLSIFITMKSISGDSSEIYNPDIDPETGELIRTGI